MGGPGRTAIAATGAVVLGAALATLAWRSREADGDPPPALGASPQILFDDFDHAARPALVASGWLVRRSAGAPGIEGARWGGVSLVAGSGDAAERLLRLTATTDGTAAGTVQAQVCRATTDGPGTSAARVRLRDVPVEGARVDSPAESFSAGGVLPGRDGSFSFVYRPGDGRAGTSPMLDVAAPDGETHGFPGSRDGWHVLVAQVGDDEISYFVDGVPLAVRRGRSGGGGSALGFGLWFEQVAARPARRYEEDVDWIFHQADAVLSPGEVAAAVASLRRIGIGFEDSVERGGVRPRSPCGPS